MRIRDWSSDVCSSDLLKLEQRLHVFTGQTRIDPVPHFFQNGILNFFKIGKAEKGAGFVRCAIDGHGDLHEGSPLGAVAPCSLISYTFRVPRAITGSRPETGFIMPQLSFLSPHGDLTVSEEDGKLVALDWGRSPFQEKTPLLDRKSTRL